MDVKYLYVRNGKIYTDFEDRSSIQMWDTQKTSTKHKRDWRMPKKDISP